MYNLKQKKFLTQIERGVIVLPKSTSKHHIIENANVFNFKLEDTGMDTLDSLNMNLYILPYILPYLTLPYLSYPLPYVLPYLT